MFEEQTPNQNQPPANLPSEPADIFEGVEKNTSAPASATSASAPNALKSGLLKPKPVSTVMPNPVYSPPAESETIIVHSDKPQAKSNFSLLIKIVIGIIGLFAFLALAYGGWYLYQKLRSIDLVKKTIPQPIETNNISETPSTVATTTETSPAQTPDILFGDGDSDLDGISNAEEKQLGTDPKNSDTDGDTLSDSDEVRIWQTDPLKSDTDGDNYSDSSEILNGYNPRGPGKFNPPMPIVRFVTSSASGTAPTYINNVIKTE